MKTVTLNVNEETYKVLQTLARRMHRSTSDVVRQAMDMFVIQHTKQEHSLADLKPVSVGKVRKPFASGDDLMGEMLGSSGER